MDISKIMEIIVKLFGSKKSEVKSNDKPPKKAQDIAKKFEKTTGKAIKIWKVGDKLSPHFSYDEMTRSQAAERNSIDNTPKIENVENLIALCENVLEPVRVHFKKPATVTSGFRCIELNRKIGSTDRSQHTKGEAADFVINGSPTVTDVWKWIIDSDLDFDQVIQEFGRWVHVSYKRSGVNRHKCSIAKKVDGKTRYFHYTEEQIEKGEYEL
jgi:hypothetical protein